MNCQQRKKQPLASLIREMIDHLDRAESYESAGDHDRALGNLRWPKNTETCACIGESQKVRDVLEGLPAIRPHRCNPAAP